MFSGKSAMRFVALFLWTALAAAQSFTSVIVHVQAASGAPFSLPALVSLVPASGGFGFNTSTGVSGKATFTGVGGGGGDYTVQVAAAGYRTERDTVSVGGF